MIFFKIHLIKELSPAMTCFNRNMPLYQNVSSNVNKLSQTIPSCDSYIPGVSE